MIWKIWYYLKNSLLFFSKRYIILIEILYYNLGACPVSELDQFLNYLDSENKEQAVGYALI